LCRSKAPFPIFYIGFLSIIFIICDTFVDKNIFSRHGHKFFAIFNILRVLIAYVAIDAIREGPDVRLPIKKKRN